MAASSSTASRSHNDYNVGWVCALPKEAVAAVALLDGPLHPQLKKPENDPNVYFLGSIGNHNVVIACLPKGEYGTNAAATVAAQMVRTFESIKIGLMVGIGGAVSPKVRLGDVVVGVPSQNFPGVVQWDMGKAHAGAIERTGSMDKPPFSLLTAISMLEIKHELDGSKIQEYLKQLGENKPKLAAKYLRLDSWEDVLFEATYPHVKKETGNGGEEESSCESCDKSKVVKRKARDMRIHYGLIASGNQVIKDAATRDKLNQDLGGQVLCVEMEAAGLINFPCLVIRGICDYSDSHKNKDWQEHAAAVAAAFAKELLLEIQPSEISQEKVLKDVQVQTLKSVNEIEKHMSKTSLMMDRAEEEKILNWITSINYGLRQSELIRRRHPGTGQWLLTSTEYEYWSQTKQQTLLCYGIPGSGKTILTAIAIDHLCSQFRGIGNTDVGIAFIYCDFQQKDEQKTEKLLESILRQLGQQLMSFPSAVKQLHNAHKGTNTRPSLNDLLTTLKTVCAQFSRTFIIIDALDELDNQHGNRKEFLSYLFQLQDSTGINIFATSRDIDKIMSLFSQALQIKVSATDEDIASFLHGQMDDSAQYDDGLKHYVSDKIVAAADGMFLLPVLQINMVNNLQTKGDIKDALNDLPKGMEGLEVTYKRTMERISSQGQGKAHLANQILGFVLVAKRPLLIDELLHALTAKENMRRFNEDYVPDLKNLQSVCTGLITIDKGSKVVRLVHYTAQEYFEKTRLLWFPNTEVELAKACLNYLLLDDFVPENNRDYHHIQDIVNARLQSYAFYGYASRFWAAHVHEALIEDDELVIRFLRCDTRITEIQQAVPIEESYRNKDLPNSGTEIRNITGLNIAAYYDLSTATECLLNLGYSPDLRDDYNFTPLMVAVIKGHKDVAGQLLIRGANKDLVLFVSPREYTIMHIAVLEAYTDLILVLLDNGVNIDSRNKDGHTPLHFLAGNDMIDITKFLLEKGADIESRDANRFTPLHYAILHNEIDIAKLFLEKGADIESKGSISEATSLHMATEKGYIELVLFLLEKGADIESRDANRFTPLHYAILHNEIDIAKLFLEKGADIESKGSISEATSLHMATEKGYIELVLFLLEKGADIESRDANGFTPLHHATSNNKIDIAKLLLEKGADIESRDANGFTPLHYTASNNKIDIAKLLLDKGANIKAKGGENKATFLHMAAENGHVDLVLILLEKGADIESRDANGFTPLHYTDNRIDIAKLFLEKGANIEAKGGEDETTPLHMAADKGYIDLVLFLLEKGADIESRDANGFTPLHYTDNRIDIAKLLLDKGADIEAKGGEDEATFLHMVAESGYTDLILFLLEKGADIESRDATRFTALHCAVSNNKIDVAKLLLDKGANIEAKGEEDETTPLHIAAENGYTDLLLILLEKGADIEARKNQGETPLYCAAAHTSVEAIALLLDRGAHIESVEENGFTPLHVAAATNEMDNVKFLISRGANVEATCNGGRTPLHYASHNNHEEMVALLLAEGATSEQKTTIVTQL